MQIGLWLGARVFAAVATDAQRGALMELLGERSAAVHIAVIKADAFLGWVEDVTFGEHFDVVIEAGDGGDARLPLSPHKLAMSLGAHGRWVTQHRALQVDPPVASQLLMRSATLAFLFPPTLTLSPGRLGVVLRAPI